MARYVTYIRASTDTQETTHQHDAINNWLDERDVPGTQANQSHAFDDAIELLC